MPRLSRVLAMFACTALIACSHSARAQPPNTRAGEVGGEEAPESPEVADERTVTTRHKVTVGGKKLRYTATAGTIHLKDADGKATAEVFYVAYTKDRVRDLSTRPITYAFNGGPGSSAVWLQMGTFGPRRVNMPDAVSPPPPPYALEDNDQSILDLTDLVFIDPVGTGFSKPVGEGQPEDFQGVSEDVRSVAEFIRLYTQRNGRWNSPKFLAGESYGTTRAAGLVNYLQNDGMFFNGVVLVSSILNFQTARFVAGNDLPYILFLPTYAASAYFHGKLPNKPADLEAFLAEVRTFARGEYAAALMEGNKLDPKRRAELVTKLRGYTGLSETFIDQADLRIHIQHFVKEVRRADGKTIGRLDSRFTGTDASDLGSSPDYDPSYSAIQGPYTAAMNHYLRDELEFEEDRKYEILSGKVNGRWNWSSGSSASYVNVADDLGRAMRQNPHLQVFVANGYYDLATPFFATEYTVDHLRLPKAAQDNVSMGYYEAGHMMYLHPPSLAALKKDLEAFYGRSVSVQEDLEPDEGDE